MDARTQALYAAVAAFFAFAVLVQRARRKLTPEQLYSLERINRISLRAFVPIVPLLVALAAAYFSTISQRLIFWISSLTMVTLFALDTWKVRHKLRAAGLPPEYVVVHFYGLWIIIAGLVVAFALLSHGVRFES